MILWLEGLLWSGPLLAGLLGSHIYFTVKLRGVQRWVFWGVRQSVSGGGDQEGVSGFGALATSLAAAIGTGNIIGVATAVALGGPGAVFWCWLTGVLGMATRYAETWLTLRDRRRTPAGTRGGPMYVLRDRLKKPGMAKCFALFGVLAALGTGALIQAEAIGAALWDAAQIPLWLSGLLIAGLAAPAILGGAERIAKLCKILVPAMAGFYLLGCGMVLWGNRACLPESLRLILCGAFRPRSAGGGFVGSTILTAARYGTARGLFTNESGMGTAPMAAAAGPCEDPVRTALISMTGVFWDTVVICAVTGLVIVSSIAAHPAAFEGAGPGELCIRAFSALPYGEWILYISLITFAFATVVGWCWYGECCWTFLFAGDVRPFRLLYLAAAFLGVFGEAGTVWSLSGILAGLMALPNLYGLLRLRQETAESLRQWEAGAEMCGNGENSGCNMGKILIE